MCSHEADCLYRLSHHTVAHKIEHFFFHVYLGSNVNLYMYEESILNDKHNVKWFHRKLVQHTITEPNVYTVWVHEWYGAYEHVHNTDIHVQVHYVTLTIVISYEIMERHSPAVQRYLLYDFNHNLVHLENTWLICCTCIRCCNEDWHG